MFRYLTTRLLYMVPVLWLVVSVVFLLIHLVPGDPVQQMLGEGAAAGDIQAARHDYGLDVPIGKQYLNYWKRLLLHGELGRSLRFGDDVARSALAALHSLDRCADMADLFGALGRLKPAPTYEPEPAPTYEPKTTPTCEPTV